MLVVRPTDSIKTPVVRLHQEYLGAMIASADGTLSLEGNRIISERDVIHGHMARSYSLYPYPN